MISVAMCTYNGERYVEEQVRSVLEQTRPPDEVVICDDASTDGTRKLLRKLEASCPVPIHIHANPVRLGSTRNFEECIKRCRGDIIFLADQDDVWHPEKFERMTRAMEQNPAAGIAFSDAEVVHHDLSPLRPSLWGMMRFTPRHQRAMRQGRALDRLLKRHVVQGSALCFRSSYNELLLPIPDGWAHDAWIPLLLFAVSEVIPIPRTLSKFRQHPAQLLGIPHRSPIERIRMWKEEVPEKHPTLARQHAEAAARLRARADRYPPLPGAIGKIEARARHEAMRGRIRSGDRRLRLVLREAVSGNYARYSRSWASAAKDLVAREPKP